MTSLNQGFVRSFNLDETIDSFKAINNLAKGTITDDLVVFANNADNLTKLIFDRLDANNTVSTDGDGTVFTQIDKIGTFGNGDRVRIKSIVKINDALYNQTTDTLFLTLNEPHGIDFPEVDSVAYIIMQNTYFDGPGTIILNNKTFVAKSGGGANQLLIFGIGLKTPAGTSLSPGLFSPNFNNVARYPYIESSSIPLPSVSGLELAYDGIYYVVYSNAINKFKIGRNFSRINLISQINFGFLTKNIVFERINECTQNNLSNLASPQFQDVTFTYDNQVLQRTFSDNFRYLESLLDAANYFKVKKYLTTKDNIFSENELSFEGNLLTSDPDAFNITQSSLSNNSSPGVFILDKDLSTTTNILKTRAYSDNTQPWELTTVAGVPTLQYEVLRNKITGARQSLTTQEMQIGNLILADSAAAQSLEISGITNVTILSTPLATPISYADAAKVRFTHKLQTLINGEIYSICLSRVIT
jgi:hypothetical protein